MSMHSGQTFQTNKPGISKRRTAGRKAVKVIEWYFYPEFASKKLFKNTKCVKLDLKAVAGQHFEVLSQASNVQSNTSVSKRTTSNKYLNTVKNSSSKKIDLLKPPQNGLRGSFKQATPGPSSMQSNGAGSTFEYISTPSKSIHTEDVALIEKSKVQRQENAPSNMHDSRMLNLSYKTHD